MKLTDLPLHYQLQYHEQNAKIMAARIPHAEPKQDAGQEPLAVNKDEARGQGRVTVIITRYATRPLDFDNGAGGCKFLLDQIRYSGLIRDDCPQEIDFIFKQEKVATKKDQGTMIEIL